MSSGDGALELGASAQRGLLGVLLTSPNVPVSADRLVDELWGDAPPPSAHHLVQVYVSRLRGLLGELPDGPRIVHEGAAYALRIAPGELDSDRFGAGVERGRELLAREPEAADEAFAAALRLWRGEPFGDLSPLPPAVRARADDLERRHLAAFEDWVGVRLQRGLHHELIPDLAAVAAAHPYDEAVHAQLMLALYRSGRQAEALETARNLRLRLREDLGLDPSTEVRDLYRDILLQDPGLELERPLPPTNLPQRLTSFVGRADELLEVEQLLAGARLVTLTGPGGIGKTRLAIEVARRVRPQYPGGVWWIDLALITEPDVVLDEVARVLGVTPPPGTDLLTAVAGALGRRRALLLVDNCEHVARAIAGPVAAILVAATGPRVLATSRVPLRVAGEQLWAVPPLRLPAVEDSSAEVEASDAVRLFLERGRAASPSFQLDAGNAGAVVEICRRLDGLSLAIEMAAARLPVLAPAEIAARLDERFALLELPLAGGARRHRSMEAALDVSYDLLSAPDRRVFERLAVFAGAFDLDGITAIALPPGTPPAQSLTAVTALVDGSLLTVERDGDRTRYRMLETLREYALARLRARGAEDDGRRAHADHHLDLAEQAAGSLGTPDFAPWMERLVGVYAELRQALGWSLDHEPRPRTLRAAPALRELWLRRGDAREARRWTSRMLDGDVSGVRPDLLADASSAAAFGAQLAGDIDACWPLIHRSIALAREGDRPESLVFALYGAMQIAFATGDVDTLRRSAGEALEVCDRHALRWARAGPLATIGFAALVRGDPPADVRAHLEAAVPLYRELGDVGGLTLMVLGPLSLAALGQRDLEAAASYAAEAIELASGNGWQASALACYAQVLTASGDLDGGGAAAVRALRVALDAGLENWFRIALRVLALTAEERGRFEDAAVLIGGSRPNLPPYGLDPVMYASVEARCADALGAERFDRLAAAGETMTHDELVSVGARWSTS